MFLFGVIRNRFASTVEYVTFAAKEILLYNTHSGASRNKQQIIRKFSIADSKKKNTKPHKMSCLMSGNELKSNLIDGNQNATRKKNGIYLILQTNESDQSPRPA